MEIEGNFYKPTWEQEGTNGGWSALSNNISDILEKKANIKKKESEHQWHQEDVVKKADESELAEPARRYYDLNNKTQCRQHLVHGNEWMTVSRIVKIRRIYREVTFSISSGKKKQAQRQQAGMKANKSASGKKKKKRA